MDSIRGRVLTVGDDVSTDEIVPGRYLKLSLAEQVPHVLEGRDPTFAARVRAGDVLVAGRNFGRGSSRESAPAALREAGITLIVADFFARIFFRNAVNLGLPVLECRDAARIADGDEIEAHLARGEIRNLRTGESYRATPLPDHILSLLQQGGLMPYLRQWVAARRLK
jgi:3-isopropylmalate/(R)-2-methylmalate dehydratase small subunit